MKLKKGTIGKYLFDGLLIVFSVLFALFINRLAENSDLKEKKKAALTSIRSELYRNAGVLELWQENHVKVRDRIDSLLTGKNDSLMRKLQGYDYLNLGELMGGENLVNAIFVDTSWESAKSTGIVSEFDFEITQQLTSAYDMQNELTKSTLGGIRDILFERETHQIDQLRPTLRQLQFRFYEVVGQEIVVEKLISEALNELKDTN